MISRSIVLLALVTVATATSLPKSSNSCQGCRSIVSYARQFNSTSHRQEYKDLFKGFCEQYYPVSTDFQQGPCPLFVEGLFYVLDNTDPIHHCDQIGACGSVGTDLPSDDIYDYLKSGTSNQFGADEGPVCEFCVQVVDQVKATLSNPTIIDRVRQEADSFCDYLSVIGQDKSCKNIIDRYLTQALEFIKEINPNAYCRSIAMCRAGKIVNKNKSLERQLPTLADFNNFGIETSVSIGPKQSLDTSASTNANGGECVLCKTLVKEMFKFLRENKTEANIIDGLNRVCHLLYPREGPGLEQCQGMVKAYTRELVQLLVDETDPDMICMLLSMCTYEKSPAPSSSIATNALASEESSPVESGAQNDNLRNLISALDPTIGVNSMRNCVECKMFIAYLKETFENPKSQEEVKNWLLANLCKQLPGAELVNTCTNMVQTYASVFFKAIAGDLNPQAACVELGVCKAHLRTQVLRLTDPLPSPQPQVPPADATLFECRFCTDVVFLVDNYLSSHSIGDDISSLSEICDSTTMQPEQSQKCRSMIEEHGSDLIQMVQTMENPRGVCTQLAKCPSN